ncbi:MAG: RidA family protein [Thermomicrobiales bacterium]|nr:RidA family protein [Thermomicrobiales bacterium]MCO5222545.1 RidA family protein [Thermomicrobiales bacterium]
MTNTHRQLVSSGGPWEAKGGYSRAVRVGDHVYVAGTTGMKDGQLVGPGDVVAQTRQTMTTIVAALHEAGAHLGDVVRYRVYLTNIEDNTKVMPLLGEYFGQVRPAGTLVGVQALIDPEMRVEIEVEAIRGSGLEPVE